MTSLTDQQGDYTLLVVEGDVIARHALVEYLRDCGYSVVAAASTEEAWVVLEDADLPVYGALCALPSAGTQTGFALARWIRDHRPDIDVVLAGTLDAAAEAAGDYCEDGPRLARPYDTKEITVRVQMMRERRRQLLSEVPLVS